MWISVALAVVAGAFIAALYAIAAVRCRPIALAAPVAFAAVVGLEAVLLNALSLFHAFTRVGVVAAHLVGIAALLALPSALGRGRIPASRLARRAVRSVRALALPGVLLAPLVPLLILSALRYAPSNVDSMSYHLARVAHWIQGRSVQAYPTHVIRQVAMMPGAEYLLASLQVVSGTDQLASLVQLGSWVLCVLSAPALARIAGAPRRLSPWAAVIVASIPMGLLQATSTQNDLVATATVIAVIASALPLLHRRRTWRVADAAVLAVALAAAALVKASAVLAAVPIVVLAVAQAARAPLGPARRVTAALLAAAALGALVVGPDLVRSSRPEVVRRMAPTLERYVYRDLTAVSDRLANVARGVVRHLPVPREVVVALGLDPEKDCGASPSTCADATLRPHEDFVGNPFHVLLVVAAGVLVVARWRHIPLRSRIALAIPASAWVLFHLVFRDNVWISRLETPSFALTGLALAAWSARRGEAPPRLAGVATAAVAVVALAYGAAVVVRNQSRPPLLTGSDPWSPEALGYYYNRAAVAESHDAALWAAEAVGCRRLGLYISGDAYDYPLTWRAMQRGIAVRHVFGADPWPCLVFADRAGRPEDAEMCWRATPVPFVFLNTIAASE